MPGLTKEEKETLKNDVLYRPQLSQTDCSELAKYVSGDRKSPGRCGDDFDCSEDTKGQIADFFTLGQQPYYPDGPWIKYIKEKISAGIDAGLIKDETEARSIMKSEFENFKKNIQEAVDNKDQKKVSTALKDSAWKLNNPQKAINDIKQAIDQMLQLNKTFFKPTGVKEMLSEIKKFNKLKNPTDNDRAALISKIQSIAGDRLKIKNERSGLLEDFYQKVVLLSNNNVEPINKEALEQSKKMNYGMQKIAFIFSNHTDPSSTYGKINNVLSQAGTVEQKIAGILKVLETSLNDGRPLGEQFEKEYLELQRYFRNVQQGKIPDLNNKVDYPALNAKALVTNLENLGLVETRRPSPK